jgi:hypothetical protein
VALTFLWSVAVGNYEVTTVARFGGVGSLARDAMNAVDTHEQLASVR